MTDIRVQFSFKGHRKRKRANMLLGLKPSATDYVLDLWIATGENNPDGILRGMDEVDIALEAGWEGDAQVFVDALVQSRWLDKHENGTYVIHDWEEHQRYLVFSERRSLQAQMAAAKKYGNNEKYLELKQLLYPGRKRTASQQDTDRTPPSPSPSPNKRGSTEFVNGEGKLCLKCHNPFIPKSKDHDLCTKCYRKSIGHPSHNWEECEKCHTQMPRGDLHLDEKGICEMCRLRAEREEKKNQSALNINF